MPVVSDAGRHGAQAEPSSPRVVSRDRPLERSTPAPPLQPQTLPTFAVGDEGETNKDIWPRALALVREGMTDAAFKVWMEPTALIARDSDGTFVVGARNKVQRERLERQHLDEITRALGAVLGRDVRVRIAMLDEHHAQ